MNVEIVYLQSWATGVVICEKLSIFTTGLLLVFEGRLTSAQVGRDSRSHR